MNWNSSLKNPPINTKWLQGAHICYMMSYDVICHVSCHPASHWCPLADCFACMKRCFPGKTDRRGRRGWLASWYTESHQLVILIITLFLRHEFQATVWYHSTNHANMS
jgi:hypothetical protein